MCGLVGLVAPHPSRSRLEQSSKLLIHRGPDDSGSYLSGTVALAVRRLSIIDVEGGHQPIGNESGRIWVACNGEIVNAPALRAILEAAGHRFRSQCDTETIVHGYEEWGDEVATRLQGMFAFAIWDADRQRLLLVRDRFGIKPLVYARMGDTFAFASEIRPLLGMLPELPRRASGEALWRLFEVGYVPSPLTAVEGVAKLPPAHLLTLQDGKVRLRCYWAPRFPRIGEHRTVSFSRAATEFAAALRATVDAWRLSDVPVGALLSGGIDSASLATLLSELDDERVATFTIGFSATSHDESALARDTARALGSAHHELLFAPADFDRLPEVIRCLEEPRCSATSVPLHRLYRACHEEGFKVVLTGEGADELLGGYHWFSGDWRARQVLTGPSWLAAGLARAPVFMSPAARRVLVERPLDALDRYATWQQVADPSVREGLLRRRYPPVTEAWREEHAAALSGRDPFDQFLFLESRTRLADEINLEVDRTSMSHSVEARPPFLDHVLWEACAELPPRMKLGWLGGGKRLLRHGMRAHLPRRVRRRRKRGLATPHAAWWRAARLPDWAETALSPETLRRTGFFDPIVVAGLRESHRIGRRDASRILMGVLTTQLWHAEVLTP